MKHLYFIKYHVQSTRTLSGTTHHSVIKEFSDEELIEFSEGRFIDKIKLLK